MTTPRAKNISRSMMLQCPSVSAGMRTARPPKTRSEVQATARATARPRRDRKRARASRAGSVPLGPLGLVGVLTESQAAGRDVGDEDGPGAEVVELVHEPVAADARHHGAHGHPRLVLHGRRRGRLETWR